VSGKKPRYITCTHVGSHASTDKQAMRITTIVIPVLLLVSCDKSIRFEVPQPEGRRNEKSLPKKLIGQYSSLTDSSVLTITGGLIVKRKVINLSIALSSLDSAERATVKHDTVYTTNDMDVKIDTKVKKDSVFQLVDYNDTIFSDSRGDILRKFKGHYFINHQTSKNRWSVTKMTRLKGGLALGTVSKVDDIKNLRELTGTVSDTTDNFRPTKKELKKFLKENGFGNEETFIKVD
jgi:hypothetical protein